MVPSHPLLFGSQLSGWSEIPVQPKRKDQPNQSTNQKQPAHDRPAAQHHQAADCQTVLEHQAARSLPACPLSVAINDFDIAFDLFTITLIMVMLQIDDHFFLIADAPPTVARLDKLTA